MPAPIQTAKVIPFRGGITFVISWVRNILDLFFFTCHFKADEGNGYESFVNKVFHE